MGQALCCACERKPSRPRISAFAFATIGSGAAAILPATSRVVRAFELAEHHRGHEHLHGSTSSVVASADDRWLLTASNQDKIVKIWDLKTGACAKTIDTLVRVMVVATSANGKVICVGSTDGIVKMFNRKGSCTNYIQVPSTGPIAAAALSFDGSMLFLATSPAGGSAAEAASCQVRAFSTRDGVEMVLFRGHEAPVNCIAFAATVPEATATSAFVARLLEKQGGMSGGAGGGGFDSLLLGGGSGSVAISARKRQQLVDLQQQHLLPPRDVLVTGSEDGTARIWSVSSGRCVMICRHAGAGVAGGIRGGAAESVGVISVAVSADGGVLFTGGGVDAPCVKCFDLSSVAAAISGGGGASDLGSARGPDGAAGAAGGHESPKKKKNKSKKTGAGAPPLAGPLIATISTGDHPVDALAITKKGPAVLFTHCTQARRTQAFDLAATAAPAPLPPGEEADAQQQQQQSTSLPLASRSNMNPLGLTAVCFKEGYVAEEGSAGVPL